MDRDSHEASSEKVFRLFKLLVHVFGWTRRWSVVCMWLPYCKWLALIHAQVSIHRYVASAQAKVPIGWDIQKVRVDKQGVKITKEILQIPKNGPPCLNKSLQY